MATATHSTALIGVFDTRDGARRAVEALHRAGFSNNQITMVMHHDQPADVALTDLDAAKAAQVTGEAKEGEGAAVGAVAGAVIGGAVAVGVLAIPGFGPALLAGGLLAAPALAGVATGAGVGFVGGGIVGALVGLDFPEEEARLYERELKAGKAIVGVHAGHRENEAWDIMRTYGGYALEPEHAAVAAEAEPPFSAAPPPPSDPTTGL